MKTIDSWNDLQQFGIDRLTGEACAYGMRQLCDLDERGAKTWREFMGLPFGCALAENWNSKGVASAMIPYELLGQLSAFCLLADGASAVVMRTDGAVEGFYPDDEAATFERHMDFLRQCNRVDRTYSHIGGPAVGSRMVHAMSGRSE